MFGLGVGPTKVDLTWEGDRLSFAWMEQGRPVYKEPMAPRPDIIKSIGLVPETVDHTGLPIEEISCGNAVPDYSGDARAAPSTPRKPTSPGCAKLKSAFPGGHVGALFFTTEPVDADVLAYSRMFAPSAGVIEDPATGSAAGPLGCYMVKHGLVRRDQMQDFINLQGVAMGRPSRLHMRIEQDGNGAITRVQVGGKAVRVGEGTIEPRSPIRRLTRPAFPIRRPPQSRDDARTVGHS